jgi:hypothetical protein
MTMTDPARSAAPVSLGDSLVRKFVLGSTLAASVALYAYEVVKNNPQESFQTLRQFGPSFLVTIVALVLLWDLLKIGVTNVGRLADSMQTLSTAVTEIAEKDDRQLEEMRRIGQFNAQNSERMLGMMLEQAAQLKSISETLTKLGQEPKP